MSYTARNTQTGERTGTSYDPYGVLNAAALSGWEDCETEIMEWQGDCLRYAEFPCTYSFHYGEESYTCELTANRPDSLCPFHAGEEE